MHYALYILYVSCMYYVCIIYYARFMTLKGHAAPKYDKMIAIHYYE